MLLIYIIIWLPKTLALDNNGKVFHHREQIHINKKPATSVVLVSGLSELNCALYCAKNNKKDIEYCSQYNYYNTDSKQCYCEVENHQLVTTNTTQSLVKIKQQSQCWKYLLKRTSDSVRFDRTWQEYKQGFGDSENFWIGLDEWHNLTRNGVRARFVLTDWNNNTVWADYNYLRVDNEVNKYKLNISGHTGPLCDSMSHHNGMMFSTLDQDNDDAPGGDCANNNGGFGWWYKLCFKARLTGEYYNLPEAVNTNKEAAGIMWPCYKGFYYSMKQAEIFVLCDWISIKRWQGNACKEALGY